MKSNTNNNISEISLIIDTSSDLICDKEIMQSDFERNNLFESYQTSNELNIFDKTDENHSSDNFFFRKITNNNKEIPATEALEINIKTLAFLNKQNLLDKLYS
jgi:hypothetical protein